MVDGSIERAGRGDDKMSYYDEDYDEDCDFEDEDEDEDEDCDCEEDDEGEDCGYAPGMAPFAEPGGNSALRAGKRCFPCPTCGEPNSLTKADVELRYQCDSCANRAEGWGG